ncbi:MAG TPA: hypothetical protein VGR02_06660 [Thermoanaerobaculia bacterium]|jgi:hypothetical protein|nr:hypothetical protein [Thermoanaerobaculia bacterium]
MRWRILTPVIVVGLLLGVASAFGITKGIEPWLWIAIGAILAIPTGNQLRENTFRQGAVAGLITCGGAALIEAVARPSLLHFALIFPYAILGGAAFGGLTWVVQTVFAE